MPFIDFRPNNNPNWSNPSSTRPPTELAVYNFLSADNFTTLSINNNATVNLNTIFPNYLDGEYLVYRSDDALTFGRFFVKVSTNDAVIVDGSSNFAGVDVSGNLCLIMNSGQLAIKNRLGSDYVFVFYRRGS